MREEVKWIRSLWSPFFDLCFVKLSKSLNESHFGTVIDEF